MESLRRRAEAGDRAAMSELGLQLLTGADGSPDPQQAVSWLRPAADQDDPAALCLLATLTAAGAVAPPDWPAALADLARAASLGVQDARAQLQLLATGSLLPAPLPEHQDTWRDLARSVDMGAWMTPPPRRPVWEVPRIRMAEPFTTPDVCDWIRGKAEGRLRPGLMYHGDSRAEHLDPHRSCGDYEFDFHTTDLVLLAVRERIAALTHLPTIAMEPPRIFHYALGQEIKPHYDRCGDGVQGYGLLPGYLGDRIVTFLLYLNDDFDGGELDFPKAGFRCKGAKGDAVYFAHVDTEARPEPLSLHAGLKITRGEKWVLSQWIHDRPFGVAEKAA